MPNEREDLLVMYEVDQKIADGSYRTIYDPFTGEMIVFPRDVEEGGPDFHSTN
jgi:hypothetical protein